MKSSSSSVRSSMSVAVAVAPEDLSCGDFVAVLHEIIELPTYSWCDPELVDQENVVRITRFPSTESLPLKVKTICLPFLFVKSPHGQWQTLDVRQVRLVRLQPSYAKIVWSALKKRLEA